MLKLPCQRLYNSPTLTSWSRIGVQSLRLLLLTPLVLTRLDLEEVAAWYLFAAVAMLGQSLIQNVSTVFTKMVALAIGGARDLSPRDRPEITEQPADDTERWRQVRRLYITLKAFTLFLAPIAFLIIASLGLFGVINITGHDAQSHRAIHVAFAIVAGGAFIQCWGQQYVTMLRGLNHVALVNRWDTLFTGSGILLSAAALLLGGDIVALAAVTQGFTILNVIRNRLLLGERVAAGFRFGGWRLEREIIRWVWNPLYRGLVTQMSYIGVLQGSGVIFTAFGDTAAVTAYLFALRIMTMINQIAASPITSHTPRFSRMFAEGKLEQLQEEYIRKMRWSVWLAVGGVIGGGATLPGLLNLINANIEFIPPALWLLFGLFSLHNRFNACCTTSCGMGNVIILAWRQVLAGVVSLGALFLSIQPLGLLGVILSLGLGPLLIMHVSPERHAVIVLEKAPGYLYKRIYLPAVLFFLASAIVTCLLCQAAGQQIWRP